MNDLRAHADEASPRWPGPPRSSRPGERSPPGPRTGWPGGRGRCRARVVTARGQRLAHASAKQRGITFPDGTGQAGQYRSGWFAAADTVLAGGSSPRVVMSNRRGQARAWRGGRYWDAGHVTGRRGILPTRVPIAGVTFAAAACAVVSCGSAGTGARRAGAAGIPAVTSPCAVPAARPGREVAGPAGSFSVGGQLDGVAAAPASGVWAAGSSTLGNPLTVRWDGRAWKPVPAPGGDHLTSPEGGYLNDVAAVSADDAWTVGAGMFDRALIEHWDGTAWTSPAGFCSNPSAPACYPAGNTSQAAATQPATSRTPPPSSTALSPAPDRPGLNHGAEGLGEFNGS